VLHFSPVQTGFAYLPMAVMVMASARIVPRLLRRYSPKSLLLIGTPMQAIALLWLSRLSETSSYVDGAMGPMILCGIAMGLCNIPLTSLALSKVDRRDAGAASGLTQTMMSVGGSFGLAVLVTVFGFAAGTAGLTHADAASRFVFGATHAFIVASALASLGFISALVLIRTPGTPSAAKGRNAEAQKSVVRRYLEMLNNGRHADAHAMLHPDWIDHVVGEHGEEVATDSMQIVIDRMISEGDHVAVQGTVHRRHDGSETRSRVMWFIRVQEDKIAELWSMREPIKGGSADVLSASDALTAEGDTSPAVGEALA